MRISLRLHFLCFFVLTVLWNLTPQAAPLPEETLAFGRFGNIYIYRNSPQPEHVVLFVSGDGGWNLGVIDMARALADLDALVAGIDITTYLKDA